MDLSRDLLIAEIGPLTLKSDSRFSELRLECEVTDANLTCRDKDSKLVILSIAEKDPEFRVSAETSLELKNETRYDVESNVSVKIPRIELFASTRILQALASVPQRRVYRQPPLRLHGVPVRSDSTPGRWEQRSCGARPRSRPQLTLVQWIRHVQAHTLDHYSRSSHRTLWRRRAYPGRA